MTQIGSLKEANELLSTYMPKAKEVLSKDVTLERMAPLMTLLDNPQDKLRIVHIAGTSGKTSTAYYLASLLKESGKKVGLTVSPHIDSVTERVQVNLRPLGEDEFCQALSEFLEIIEPHRLRPTYFELLVAFAYWYFVKIGVDYAVIETGLGGLHDATNVASLPNKVCVITNIGYDHMQILGNQLTEIAEQKAGIIKPHNEVFMYQQEPDINAVFKARARQQNARLNVLDEHQERKKLAVPSALNTLPPYQQRNWLLAYRAFEFVRLCDGLAPLSPEALQKSMTVQIPGRMDTVHINNKTLIMDGAHNGQKMEAFIKSFQTLYPHKKAAILLALKEGKEYQSVLPLLQPFCTHLIITTFDVLQDVPFKSISPDILAEAAAEYGFTKVAVIKNPIKAYQRLLLSSENVLIITGSFYLLSALRPSILK